MKLAEAARIFKALSCEQRLKVLAIIRDMSGNGSGCTGATKAFTRCCEKLELCPSTVSHHIKELESAGLINTERHGQSVCCRVNDDVWARLKVFLA